MKRAAVNALDRDGSGAKDGGIRVTAHDLLFAYEQVQLLRPERTAAREIL